MSTPPTVASFFTAMQAGRAGAEALLALFVDDAVYVKPFSGTVRTHTGLAAIRAALEPGWAHPLPDMTITVDRVDVAGDVVRADWTCRSPGLPGGAGRGVNEFTLRAGRIVRLVTTLVLP